MPSTGPGSCRKKAAPGVSSWAARSKSNQPGLIMLAALNTRAGPCSVRTWRWKMPCSPYSRPARSRASTSASAAKTCPSGAATWMATILSSRPAASMSTWGPAGSSGSGRADSGRGFFRPRAARSGRSRTGSSAGGAGSGAGSGARGAGRVAGAGSGCGSARRRTRGAGAGASGASVVPGACVGSRRAVGGAAGRRRTGSGSGSLKPGEPGSSSRPRLGSGSSGQSRSASNPVGSRRWPCPRAVAASSGSPSRRGVLTMTSKPSSLPTALSMSSKAERKSSRRACFLSCQRPQA